MQRLNLCAVQRIFLIYIIWNLERGVYKWQFQRERHLKQEEIREEQTGSLLFRAWLNVLSAVRSSCRTEFARLAEHTRAKKLSLSVNNYEF